MTLDYTLHLKLATPDFLTEPWHDELRAMFDAVDKIIYEAIVADSIALWANSTVYSIGTVVISPDDGLLYVANVAHTSTVTPQTFTMELAAHPTFWSGFLPGLASQAEAEAGVENTKYMSALRTKQAILAISPPATLASQAEAEAGVENTKTMTPLRTKQAILAQVGPGVGGNIINGYLSWTVAGGALTVTLKNSVDDGDPSVTNPVWVRVRDTTITQDQEEFVKITAAMSATMSAGSTMGCVNNVPFRIWAVLANPAAPEIALIKTVIATATDISIYPLAAWGIGTTVAEGGAGAADTAQVFYSATAMASVGYALLGYGSWLTGLAAVGTWNVAPDRAQLFTPNIPLPGAVVQRNVSRLLTGVTSAVVIPNDDTIPQSTEGAQVHSITVSLSDTANVLRISSIASVSNSISANITAAIFQDAVANALVARGQFPTTVATMHDIPIVHFMVAGVFVTTFKLRIGPSVAATVTVNGWAGVRKLGGVQPTTLDVEEIAT